jgi:hypothetical protein
MPEMPTRLELAWKDIVATFDGLPGNVFSQNELSQILTSHRSSWRLADSTTRDRFIAFLIERGKLQQHRFELPYRPTTRFAWGKASTLEIVQTLNPSGYFSHYTALALHQLTEQDPKTIYFNVEQPAEGGGGTLTQTGIDRAFRGKCRTSKNIATVGKRELCMLNGKNTGELGTAKGNYELGRGLRVTNIERSLIDATVRPVYAGGVGEVAKAYQLAASKVSLSRLAAYLRELGHLYPYHQAVGFYLERTGAFKSSELDRFRELGIEFNFYLDYSMKSPKFIESWRLYVPQGFERSADA